ncbi:MAG: VanZ family protein, partial [Calditrichia bacterium]
MNRKIINFLLFAFILFVVYNTLIPFQFDYSWDDLPNLLAQVNWKMKGHISLTDLVGNILLFIPFGFLLYMALMYANIRLRIIWCILAGALLSFGIEFAQLFIQSRNSAPHDFFNNTIGSFLGATAASIYAHRISAISRKIFYELLETKPFLLLLVIIGLLQTVAAVMPFTVSITYSDLVNSLKATNIIPFDYHSLGKMFLGYPGKHDLEPFDWMSFIEDAIYWVAVGYLLMLCYRIYWRHKRSGKLLLFGLPLVFFPFREFMQLFIISRITDINDIISGYLGFGLGFILYLQLRPLRKRTFHHHLDLLKIPLIIYAVFILFSGLQPFDWVHSPDAFSRDLEMHRLIPFYTYFKSTSLW